MRLLTTGAKDCGGCANSFNAQRDLARRTVMKRRGHFFKGQMAVVMTFAMATLLGAMALGTDLAVVYYNWVQLQKGADIAALAGAQYFRQTPPPKVTNGNCPNGALNGPNTDAENGACAYAITNGAAPSELQINSPATSGPGLSVPAGVQTVQVYLKRTTIPLYFLKVLHPSFSHYGVSAVATAVGPSNVNGTGPGLFPLGMPPNPNGIPLAFGQSLTLALGSASGDWQWLDIPNGMVGSNTPGSAPTGGGSTQLVSNIQSGCKCDAHTGNYVTPEPGVMLNSAPMQAAVNARLPNGNISIQTYVANTFCAAALTPAVLGGDITGLNITSPQLAVVPIVDWSTSGALGASTAVPIQGFALMWLQSINLRGVAITITAQYLAGLTDIAIAGGGLNNYGAKTPIHLIQ